MEVSQPTVRNCFHIAQGTFLWRRIPACTRNLLKRVVKHPRCQLRGCGLLHALLRIPDHEALLTHPQMGSYWEGMVVEEVLRQVKRLGEGHQYAHYRADRGAEVDLVLEGDFGLVGVEIKHTSTIGGHDLRSLKGYVDQHKAGLGVVIQNDLAPRLYDNKMMGIPSHIFGPMVPSAAIFQKMPMSEGFTETQDPRHIESLKCRPTVVFIGGNPS